VAKSLPPRGAAWVMLKRPQVSPSKFLALIDIGENGPTHCEAVGVESDWYRRDWW